MSSICYARLVYVNTEYFSNQLIKKLTFGELYETLTGSPTVQNLMCGDCIRLTRACANCKYMNSKGNILASIKDWEDDQVFNDCVQFDDDERILCQYPITVDEAKMLTENSKPALKRLEFVVKELSPYPESQKKVMKAHNKYTTNGYLILDSEMSEEEEKVVEESPYPDNHVYPALAYKKSVSSDARVCFDGSSTIRGGISINQVLKRGIVAFNMRRLLQWFLTSPHIALADFRSFYQRFRLKKEQWKLTKFWWYPDLDLTQDPVNYFSTVLMFGIISVPRLTLAGLELIGNRYPEVGRELREQCYVDDLLVHEPTEAQCQAKRELVTEICSRHGLLFKGWAVSGQEADEEIQEDDGSVSFLGLRYHTAVDKFRFKMPDIFRGGMKKKGRMEGLELFKGSTVNELFQFYNGTMKYGEQLSRTLSYYDPVGLLSPLIMNFKAANRQACLETANDFKSYLSPAQTLQCCEFMTEMNKVGPFLYPRTKHLSGSTNYVLKIFGDAGKLAKQIVAYSVCEYDSLPPTISFFTGRNYLVKTASTVPKEELEALAQGAEVALEAKTNMQGKLSTIHGYSDSKIVLGWVKNKRLPLLPYHRMRVAKILRGFTDENGVLQLYYVPTKQQPADVGTKEMVKAEQVSPASMFFNGPDFLKLSPEEMSKEGILHIDDPKCLNDKVLEQDDEFRQGLAKKLRFEQNNDLLLQSERLRELERLTQGFSQEAVDKTKHMLEIAGYICNPLNMNFRKYVKTHHLVFAFLIKLLQKLQRRGIKKRFGDILTNWENTMKETISFSYICQTDLGDYKAREKASSELEELKNLIRSCFIRREMAGLDTHEMGPWSKLVLKLEQDSKVYLPEQLTLEIRYLREEFTKSSWYEDLISAELLREDDDEWDLNVSLKHLHGWYRYPGIPSILQGIKKLRVCPSMLEDQEALNCLVRLLHIRSYIKSYSKHEYASGMIRQLMRMYNKLICQYHSFHKLTLENVYESCRECKTTETNEDKVEVKAWIESGMTFNELWMTFLVDKGHKFKRLEGRDLIDDIFPRESIFAQVQLLTCDLFHRILTKEIQEYWTEAKIKQHCILRNGRLVSNWRARTLSQTLDVVSSELDKEGIPHRNLDPKWHSMIPIGDKSSPLVLCLMMYIHYDDALNPLDRTKHFSHRGISYNKFRLNSFVYVPGAIVQFTRIMKRCMTCRVRTKEEYQAVIGSISPEQAILHHGYLAVQIDQYGPLILREDGRQRELRGRSSTIKVWILSMICIATKHVFFRVLRGMDEKEISHALTRLSCRHQVPRKIYTDSFSSNIKSVAEGQLDLLLRNVAHRESSFKYEVCSVGRHQAMGLVEARQKILGKFLGSLKVDRSTPVYELEAILELVEEQINNVPLGVTLESGDPALAIVTPNILIGRGDLQRVPMGPIRVPRGFSEVKGSLERKWEEIGNLIQKSVVPELLENNKGLQEKGTPLAEGDIVMFQKKASNNFLKEWSLAKVKEIKESSDGKGRVALLEYRRAKAHSDAYSEAYNPDDFATETSYRDALDIIKLHPVISDLDIDLRRLYLELNESQKEEFKLVPDDSQQEEQQLECEHLTGTAKLTCQTCLLKANIEEDESDEASLAVFCKSTKGMRQDIVRVRLKGHPQMLQEVGENLPTNNITLRRSRQLVTVGNKYMGEDQQLSFNTQVISEAVVSRIMAINPQLEIRPQIMIEEGQEVGFTRDKLYVELLSETKVYISRRIDIEDFVYYKFKYPTKSKERKMVRFPLRLPEVNQSFIMSKPLHHENDTCVYNLVPKVQGCTRACCCHYCCQDRCPEPFVGIPWDDSLCSGPQDIGFATSAL